MHIKNIIDGSTNYGPKTNQLITIPYDVIYALFIYVQKRHVILPKINVQPWEWMYVDVEICHHTCYYFGNRHVVILAKIIAKIFALQNRAFQRFLSAREIHFFKKIATILFRS